MQRVLEAENKMITTKFAIVKTQSLHETVFGGYP
jgi:hypothetical protein